MNKLIADCESVWIIIWTRRFVYSMACIMAVTSVFVEDFLLVHSTKDVAHLIALIIRFLIWQMRTASDIFTYM